MHRHAVWLGSPGPRAPGPETKDFEVYFLGLGFRVWGLGFGFRVWGLGFRGQAFSFFFKARGCGTYGLGDLRCFGWSCLALERPISGSSSALGLLLGGSLGDLVTVYFRDL